MSELLAHTKIFDLVRKDETMPGFSPVAVVAPDWVSVVAEMDGRFMTTRQLRHGIGREVTEFVCGTVEKEESPLAAAKRELAEEAGLVVAERSFVRLGTVSPNPAFMTNAMHVFYVDLDRAVYGKVAANPGEHERLTSAWTDKAEVFRSVFSPEEGEVVPAMKMCAVALYRSRVRKRIAAGDWELTLKHLQGTMDCDGRE